MIEGLITEATATQRIMALLNQCRPDRYDPRDKEWQLWVVDQVAAEIPVDEARAIAAQQRVSAVEAAATRQTTTLFREIARSDQWPLEWFDAQPWPISLGDNERVTIRAATGADFDRFANKDRKAAAQEFSARNQACEGAEKVAEILRDRRLAVAGDLTLEML